MAKSELNAAIKELAAIMTANMDTGAKTKIGAAAFTRKIKIGATSNTIRTDSIGSARCPHLRQHPSGTTHMYRSAAASTNENYDLFYRSNNSLRRDEKLKSAPRHPRNKFR